MQHMSQVNNTIGAVTGASLLKVTAKPLHARTYVDRCVMAASSGTPRKPAFVYPVLNRTFKCILT